MGVEIRRQGLLAGAIFRIPVLGEFMARLIGIKLMTDSFVSLIEDNPEADRFTKIVKEQAIYKGFQQTVLSMIRKDTVGDYCDFNRDVGNQTREVLLIWGTEDKEIIRQMIGDIQSFISNLEFKPIDGAGHGILLKNPDSVNNLIFKFLKQIKDWAPDCFDKGYRLNDIHIAKLYQRRK